MVLVHPVVVHEHGGSADVGALANGGISHVGQVWHLGSPADGGVLGLHEPSELAVFGQVRAWAEVSERPDAGVLPDERIDAVRANHRGTFANGDVFQGAIRPDASTIRNPGMTLELHARQDGDILADGHIRIDHRGVRIHDGCAPSHCRLQIAVVQRSSRGSELHAVIHTS